MVDTDGYGQVPLDLTNLLNDILSRLESLEAKVNKMYKDSYMSPEEYERLKKKIRGTSE